VKIATYFSHFWLVHGVEEVLPIEREIPLLKIAIELLLDAFALEERLIHLEHLEKQC
jgi:hypothetical protein